MINTTNEGSKLYLYSITSVAILGGLLFGYDTAVISGAEKGLEAFFLSASDFQYNKVMHGITSSSALTGCVLGGAFSGIFASRLGRRNSLRLAAVLFFLSALGSYYPEFLFFEYGKPNMDLLVTFNLYRVLGGIGVGLASAVCPMYIAEIAPSNIRGTLVSCNQFAIIFGMLVVYFVNYLIMGDHQNPIILKDAAGVLSVSSESDMWTVFEGWRFMFGSEAFPAAFFGLLLFFVPKTPRYLVLVQQDEKAYSILEKINGKTKAQEILNDITVGIRLVDVSAAGYDENGKANAMNAAWGVVTDFNEISISMGDHKTTDNLAATGAFTVSMATEDTVVGCDYVGIESGRKVPDKFARAGFHATKSEFVNAPLIDELPMALECKVKSFDNGILVGEIVNVCADESVLTDGKIDPKKLKPIAFDPVNNTYLAMGDKVGDAFGSGKALK